MVVKHGSVAQVVVEALLWGYSWNGKQSAAVKMRLHVRG